MTQDFKKLEVWKLAHQFTLDIYRLTMKFPKSELYGMVQQFRRAAYSIGANIAEGAGRRTGKDFARALYNSFGSIKEFSCSYQGGSYCVSRNSILSLFLNDKVFSKLVYYLLFFHFTLINKSKDLYISMFLYNLMEAKVIFYRQSNLDQNGKFKLRRELLGLEQKSNFSRYSYKVKGILDEIPHYKPIDSVIIVKLGDANKVKPIFKKYKVKYEAFNIEIPGGKLTRK